MRVAVIGAGISGLGAALELAKAGVNVVMYEKEESLVGHAKTVTVDGVDLDLGFMVFNPVTCLNTVKLFESLGIDMETSYMSFSVSLDEGCGYEWGSQNGLTSLFAQKKNALNPYFWRMLQEIVKFKHDVLMYLGELESKPDLDHTETLGNFVKSRGYSELFQRAYLVTCESLDFGYLQFLSKLCCPMPFLSTTEPYTEHCRFPCVVRFGPAPQNKL